MLPRLGVNLDHVATLREARKEGFPNPFECLPILKSCGVHQVTLHVREDKRHMNEGDLATFSRQEILPVNLEMAATPEMIAMAIKYRPQTVTLVPEKRLEVTTEGGLNVLSDIRHYKSVVKELNDAGIIVSFFIDPDKEQIEAVAHCEGHAIELHTGTYARQFVASSSDLELERIRLSVGIAKKYNLRTYAGHGLDTNNLAPLVGFPEIEEYNIGFSIIARSIFIGLESAILEIQNILLKK